MGFRYERTQIPGGHAGTFATVHHMAQLIRAGSLNESVRAAATQAINRCPWKDKRCEGQAIFNWIRAHVRFVNDPWNVEMLQEAATVLRTRGGDCDDLSILGGSMLMSIGIPVRVVVIGANPNTPKAYTHVYLQAFIRGSGWTGFDTSVVKSTFGWEPPKYTIKKVFEVK